MALDLLLLSVAMPTLLLSAPMEPAALVPDKTNAANIQRTMPQMGRTHHGAKQAFRLSHFPSYVQQHHLTTGPTSQMDKPTTPQMGSTHHGAKQAFRQPLFSTSLQQNYLTKGQRHKWTAPPTPQMGRTHHGARQAFRLSHFPSSVQQHHLTTGHVTNGQSHNATNGQHSPWCKTGISPFSLSKLFFTGFPDTMRTRQMGNSSRHQCAALTSEPKRFIIHSFRSHCIITA